ncbi:hypothetical protein RHGRI_034364 [Rhododendron griersonianum]|uniref:SAM-dependent MTase DRM-type domain-containing protein n=1 Tax=Rhododendron griersonianum TaxID=479676 RepID=A0AAV6I142_9ERIC|nr:hypothetical protein RHGRI_034364 [Rhododendron griersonianum]
MALRRNLTIQRLQSTEAKYLYAITVRSFLMAPSSAAVAAPELPPFDYDPKLYTGPSADEVLAKRKKFLGPSLFHYYQKPVNLRTIVRNWWEETNQKGNLIHVADVQEVTAERIAQWISRFGGFDLVIGGSPCNNLAGRNHVSRDGLEGKHSSLFFDYFRILDLVKSMMSQY